MKIGSDASVLRLTHEGITNFESMHYFYKERIENLPSVCKKSIPSIEEDATRNTGNKQSPNIENLNLTIMCPRPFNQKFQGHA